MRRRMGLRQGHTVPLLLLGLCFAAFIAGEPNQTSISPSVEDAQSGDFHDDADSDIQGLNGWTQQTPRMCAQRHSITDCAVLRDFVEFKTCEEHLSTDVFCDGDEGVADSEDTDSTTADGGTSVGVGEDGTELEQEPEDIIFVAPDEFKKTEAAKTKPTETETLPPEEDEKGPEAELSFNYADSFNGAKVLESNQDSKGAHHILHEDTDKYYYSPCSSKKWVVLQLSEDIKVQRVTLLNAERFSSGPRQFQILGSDTYPVKEWQLLGQFEAENTGEVQEFDIEGSPPMMRFLKLKWISYFGSEYACTLTSLAVLGTTEYSTADLIVKHKKLLDSSETESSTDDGAESMPVEAATLDDASHSDSGDVAAAGSVVDVTIDDAGHEDAPLDAEPVSDQEVSPPDANATVQNELSSLGSGSASLAREEPELAVRDDAPVDVVPTSTAGTDNDATDRAPDADGATVVASDVSATPPAPTTVAGTGALNVTMSDELRGLDEVVSEGNSTVANAGERAVADDSRSETSGDTAEPARGEMPEHSAAVEDMSPPQSAQDTDPSSSEDSHAKAVDSTTEATAESSSACDNATDVEAQQEHEVFVGECSSPNASQPREELADGVISDAPAVASVPTSHVPTEQAKSATAPSATSTGSNGDSLEMTKLVHDLIKKVLALESEHESTNAYLTHLNSNYSRVMSKLKARVAAQNVTELRESHAEVEVELQALKQRDLEQQATISQQNEEIEQLRSRENNLEKQVAELHLSVKTLAGSMKQLSQVVGLSAQAIASHSMHVNSVSRLSERNTTMPDEAQDEPQTTSNQIIQHSDPMTAMHMKTMFTMLQTIAETIDQTPSLSGRTSTFDKLNDTDSAEGGKASATLVDGYAHLRLSATPASAEDDGDGVDSVEGAPSDDSAASLLEKNEPKPVKRSGVLGWLFDNKGTDEDDHDKDVQDEGGGTQVPTNSSEEVGASVGAGTDAGTADGDTPPPPPSSQHENNDESKSGDTANAPRMKEPVSMSATIDADTSKKT